VMTLSLDSVLLVVLCEVRFEGRRAESVASESSSVSVCGGGGEDSGSGDEAVAGVEVDWGAVNGTGTDGTALRRDDSSGSLELSAANLAGGKIFRAGRKDITVVYCQ
jgi:hypothetical protein